LYTCIYNDILVLRLHTLAFNFFSLIKEHFSFSFMLFSLCFKALDMRPTDRKCLIARAQCYHRLGEADKALADANETLRDDNKYVKVS